MNQERARTLERVVKNVTGVCSMPAMVETVEALEVEVVESVVVASDGASVEGRSSMVEPTAVELATETSRDGLSDISTVE